MPTKNQQRILDAVNNGDGRKLRTDYSGRAMYGSTCWGVTCSDPEDLIAEVGVKGARMDGMGHRTIVYWPQITGELVTEQSDGTVHPATGDVRSSQS